MHKGIEETKRRFTRDFFDAGWHITPLLSKPGEEHRPRYKKHHETRWKPEQFEEGSNIGLILHNTVVLDFDPDKDADGTAQRIFEHILRVTEEEGSPFLVSTRGENWREGAHLYFSGSGMGAVAVQRPIPGIPGLDFLGRGHVYTIAPGSFRAREGKPLLPYVLHSKLIGPEDLPEAPRELREVLENAKQSPTQQRNARFVLVNRMIENGEMIPKGKSLRNEALIGYVKDVLRELAQRSDLDDYEAFVENAPQALQDWADHHLEQSDDMEQEIRSTAWSYARKYGETLLKEEAAFRAQAKAKVRLAKERRYVPTDVNAILELFPPDCAIRVVQEAFRKRLDWDSPALALASTLAVLGWVCQEASSPATSREKTSFYHMTVGGSGLGKSQALLLAQRWLYQAMEMITEHPGNWSSVAQCISTGAPTAAGIRDHPNHRAFLIDDESTMLTKAGRSEHFLDILSNLNSVYTHGGWELGWRAENAREKNEKGALRRGLWLNMTLWMTAQPAAFDRHFSIPSVRSSLSEGLGGRFTWIFCEDNAEPQSPDRSDFARRDLLPAAWAFHKGPGAPWWHKDGGVFRPKITEGAEALLFEVRKLAAEKARGYADGSFKAAIWMRSSERVAQMAKLVALFGGNEKPGTGTYSVIPEHVQKAQKCVALLTRAAVDSLDFLGVDSANEDKGQGRLEDAMIRFYEDTGEAEATLTDLRDRCPSVIRRFKAREVVEMANRSDMLEAGRQRGRKGFVIKLLAYEGATICPKKDADDNFG